MTEYNQEIPRSRDRIILTFLVEASKIIDADTITVNVLGASRGVTFKTNDINEITSHPLYNSDEYTIYSASVGAHTFALKITRDQKQDANFTFDYLWINNTASQNPSLPMVDADAVAQLSKLISTTFLARPDLSSGLFHSPKAFERLMKSHQKMMEQLQETATSVGERLVQARLNLENEYAQQKTKLDAEFETRQTESEKTLEQLRRSIAEQEEALRKREKDIDDRNNTHARRELHRELKAKIAERSGEFRVTVATKRNRYPIHLAVAISAVGLFYLLYLYADQFSAASATATPTILLVLAIKPLGITLALLGLMAWYLRWLNRWFERYADTEFHLKQFDLDIDRASWAVEAALEWKLSQDRPMPEHLLETISRNLFSKSEKDETADMHPADYLASAILGRASSLDLKLPGGEISLNKKDIKQLSKD